MIMAETLPPQSREALEIASYEAYSEALDKAWAEYRDRVDVLTNAYLERADEIRAATEPAEGPACGIGCPPGECDCEDES